MADIWKRDAAPVLAPLYADFVRFAAPRPDDCALDVGCGTGGVVGRLAGHVRILVGLDLSLQSLRHWKTGASPSLKAVCGDLHAPPFRPHAFTLITASFALNATLPFESLPAIRRLLADGGRLVLQEWGPVDPFSEAADAVLQHHATSTPPPALATLRDRLATLPPVWDRYVQDVEDYVTWLEDTGLTVESAGETAPVCIEVPTVAVMVRFLLARPDRHAEVQAMSPAARRSLEADLHRVIAQHAQPDGSVRWEPILFRVRATARARS